MNGYRIANLEGSCCRDCYTGVLESKWQHRMCIVCHGMVAMVSPMKKAKTCYSVLCGLRRNVMPGLDSASAQNIENYYRRVRHYNYV